MFHNYDDDDDEIDDGVRERDQRWDDMSQELRLTLRAMIWERRGFLVRVYLEAFATSTTVFYFVLTGLMSLRYVIPQ